MKLAEKLQGLIPLGFILIVLYLVLSLCEIGSANFCGFGVDTSERIYVGRFHTIEVFEKGEIVNTIPSPVNRGWSMTVSQENHIIVSDGSTVYTLELDGTIVSTEEDFQSEVIHKNRRKKTAIDKSGNTYKLKTILGYKWITKNNKIVYTLPLVDVITKLALALGCLSFTTGLISYKTFQSMSKKNSPKDKTFGWTFDDWLSK